MENITLWSIQPVYLWEKLQQEKVLYVDPTHEEFLPVADGDGGVCCPIYQRAYDYIREQSVLRIPGYNYEHYPWWAWYKNRNKYAADLRMMSRWYRPDDPQVRLKLVIPSEKVLISDYSAYHCVLNGGYCSLTAEEDRAWDKEWCERLGGTVDTYEYDGEVSTEYNYHRCKYTPEQQSEWDERVKQSWSKIFDYEYIANTPQCDHWISDGSDLQATFEELRLDQVQQVTPFKGRRKIK